jgi:hypothetical protein
VCHETWLDVPDDTPGAICRGYLDATGNDALALGVAQVLGRVQLIPPVGAKPDGLTPAGLGRR